MKRRTWARFQMVVFFCLLLGAAGCVSDYSFAPIPNQHNGLIDDPVLDPNPNPSPSSTLALGIGSPDDPSDGGDGLAPSPSPSPSPSTLHSPSSSPSPSPSPSPSLSPSSSAGSNPGDDNSQAVVECDLGGPSDKIASSVNTLVKLVGQNGNSSSNRICMSAHACLNLINDYAVLRGCSLDSGAPTTPTHSGQCTQVFPGSNGTCEHASVLSDQQIKQILSSMGQ